VIFLASGLLIVGLNNPSSNLELPLFFPVSPSRRSVVKLFLSLMFFRRISSLYALDAPGRLQWKRMGRHPPAALTPFLLSPYLLYVHSRRVLKIVQAHTDGPFVEENLFVGSCGRLVSRRNHVPFQTFTQMLGTSEEVGPGRRSTSVVVYIVTFLISYKSFFSPPQWFPTFLNWRPFQIFRNPRLPFRKFFDGLAGQATGFPPHRDFFFF